MYRGINRIINNICRKPLQDFLATFEKFSQAEAGAMKAIRPIAAPEPSSPPAPDSPVFDFATLNV